MNFDTFVTNSYSDRLSYLEAIKKLHEDLLIEKYFEFDFLDFTKKCLKKIEGEETFPNHLFHLLNAYELNFLESGLKEKYPKVYYQIYYCFYLMHIKWENEAVVKEVGNWIQKKWLTVCFNSLSDKSLKFWLESRIIDPQRPIDVEEDVRNILFDKEGNLKKEFQDDKGEMQFYASRSVDWFLKRYDWKSALSVYGKKIRKRFLLPTILLVLANIIFICSITGDFIYSLFYSNFQFDIPISLNVSATVTKDVVCKNTIMGAPYYMEISLLIWLSILIFATIRKGFEFVRFCLPRLIGALFIGFIPLVAGPEMFTFPLRLNWIQISGISLVLILMVFFYLIIECHTIIGKRGIFKRAFPVILYGLFVSFMMSLFICDITAVDFIDYTRAINYTGYKGLFGGVIYPRIVIFNAPAALLIGIFVQVFWEEKTITEPL